MKKLLLMTVLALSLTLSACGDETIEFDANQYIDLSEGDNANTALEIEEELDSVYLEIDESEIDFDRFDYEEGTYTLLSDSSELIYITEAGSYLLEGTYSSTIVINVEDEDVNLVLNNATLSSSTGPAIVVLDADDVTFSVPEGTESTLSDASEYTLVLGEEDLDSVIYSKSDLEFNGLGTLNIEANYNNAIHTKDDIKISDLTLNIESVDDGIIGKDYVAIKNAVINVVSSGDAIKSTNDEETDKGFIYIESGTFDLETNNDGIQAVNDIIIYDGTFTVDTADNAFTSDNSIYLGNGTYTVDSDSDAFNAVDELIIYDGTYTVNAGDDAFHSDNILTIDGGSILVESCYEGIEGYDISINGGTITVNSTDDAVNGTTGGGQQHGTTYTSTGGLLDITGGIMQINAVSGDGIDVNGSITMSGGYVLVYGTSADNQAALDFDETFDITGGTIIAIGSTGMILSLSNSSTQASITYADTEVYSAGTVITLYDDSDNILLSVEAIRDFTGAVISLESLSMNNSYTLKVDSETYDFEVLSIVTSLGDGGNTMTMGGGPGRR